MVGSSDRGRWGWPRCSPACSINVASRVLVVGGGRAAGVLRGIGAGPDRVAAAEPRRSARRCPGCGASPAKLARRNAMRNPKRTAASASALMIGVGLVGFFTILASSSTASVNAAIDRAVAGDIVIDSGGGLMGGVDPGLAQQLGKLPQVATAAGVGIGLAEVNGKVGTGPAVDPGAASKLFDVNPVQGSIAGLGRNGIAVYKNVATAKHLKLGSTVLGAVQGHRAAEAEGRADLRGSCDHAGRALLHGQRGLQRQLHRPVRHPGLREEGPGASTAAAMAAVRAVATKYSGTTVMDQAAFKADQAKPMQQLLDAGLRLLALAILIALLGIGNTWPCRSSNAPTSSASCARRDDQTPAARHDPLGVGDHRPAGDGPRPADRRVLRLGDGAGHAEPGHHRVQRPLLTC